MNIHTKWCLSVFFSGACMLSTHASAQDSAVNDISKSLLAAEAYEQHHWGDAFTLYAQLADTGNAEAARIAYQMWKFDAPLYAAQFSATPVQLERWRTHYLTGALATTARSLPPATAP